MRLLQASRRHILSSQGHFTTSMAAQQKIASIVIVGLPWDDEKLRAVPGVDPAKVKEGVETVDRLLAERGFGRVRSVMASDKTGLDEFKEAIRQERRDALFLGGGLREGWLFDDFRKKVIDAAKEIQPDIKVVQVTLMKGPQSIVDQVEEVEKGLEK